MPSDDFTKTIAVWTRGSNLDANRRFFPLSAVMRSDQIAKIRPSLRVYCSTGDVKVEAAVQTSDDGCVWPAANVFTVIGTTSQIDDGTSYGTTFEAVTLNEAYARLGVVVRNDTGSGREHAAAAARFEIKAC